MRWPTMPGTGRAPSGPASWTGRSCGCRSTRRWWRTGARRCGSCGAATASPGPRPASSPRPSCTTPGTTSASVLPYPTDLQVEWENRRNASLRRRIFANKHFLQPESSSRWPRWVSEMGRAGTAATWATSTTRGRGRRAAETRSPPSQTWR